MPFRNLVFSSFDPSDRDALSSHLKPMAVSAGQVLLGPDHGICKVYFPIDAAVSLVVPLLNGRQVEAAMVGRDSILGVAPALSYGQSAHLAVVRAGGVCLTCEAAIIKSAASASATLLSSLAQNEQRLTAHAHQMVACSASHKLEARLSRWVLRKLDLVGGNQIQSTQEQIVELLGAQRSFISKLLESLKRKGFLEIRRGKIVISNREALDRLACECHSKIRSIYQRGRP